MLAAGLALAVCYFLSASRLSVHELVAGAVAWSAAMGFVLRVRSGRDTGSSGRAGPG